jgi:hypothetical protein
VVVTLVPKAEVREEVKRARHVGYSLESDGSSPRRRSVLPAANIEWIIGTVIGMDGSPRRRTMLMNAPSSLPSTNRHGRGTG